MRSSTLASLAAVALVQADTGCTVDFELYGSGGTAENVIVTFLSRMYDTMDQTISSNCCGWISTSKSPFSVLVYAGIEDGYDTNAELEAALDPWIGTYLRSGTATPSISSSYPYDYLVTNVTCA